VPAYRQPAGTDNYLLAHSLLRLSSQDWGGVGSGNKLTKQTEA